MSQKPIFYTGCVFHADILDRVCFSYQYFRQSSILVLRKILDRVGFEHQVGTYPYENDRSTPPPPPPGHTISKEAVPIRALKQTGFLETLRYHATTTTTVLSSIAYKFITRRQGAPKARKKNRPVISVVRLLFT